MRSRRRKSEGGSGGEMEAGSIENKKLIEKR